MKKYLIILLVLIVVAFAQTQAFAQYDPTETQIRDEAIIKLRQIYTGQFDFLDKNSDTHPPPPRARMS